jgi:transcriptional regulator with XRE-family HTH domain
MGKYPRRKQRRLADKLLQIRVSLNLSQNEILRHLGLDEELSRTNISNYELDQREPPLFVLLQYAHLSGVCLDVLVDDDLELPKRLPSVPAHFGTQTRSIKRRVPRGQKK